MLRDREGTMLALLGVVADSGEPVGTRTAATALQQRFDTKLSESTVSRLLQEMDRRGWTTPVATKGRVLTPEGRARHEKLLISTQASDTLSTAVSVHTVAGLLELLHARKAVESAVAADAARHCAAADVEELEKLTQAQADDLAAGSVQGRPGLTLHRKIADMAANALLKVLSGVVLAPQLDHVDLVMDIILGEHHHEMSVVDHHRAVVKAIEAGDPEAAEAAMNRHFTEMIDEAEKYLVGRNASVVAKLLEFMESHPGNSPAKGM
jgi:GntR family transcriptional regulator, transcriptional repressor for pyruvate dehydrogenase complex